MGALQPGISHLIPAIFFDSFGDSECAFGVGFEGAYGELYGAGDCFEPFDAKNASAIPFLAIWLWSLSFLHLGQVQGALNKYQSLTIGNYM
jgi:hypothetical protein